MKFPQPTTVLGCIRNKILAQSGLMGITSIPSSEFLERNEVQSLTGTSKVTSLSDDDDNLGVIEKISPVFLIKRNKEEIEDALFRMPVDVVESKYYPLICCKYDKVNNAKSNYSGRIKEYAILSTKPQKSSATEYYGGMLFWDAYLNDKLLPYDKEYEESNIFVSHKSVGIERKNRKAKEGAFYLKIDYSLNEGFSFALIVWLTLDEKNSFVFQDGTVILGGERSTFHMRVLPIENDLEKKFSSHPVLKQIIDGKCNLIDNLKESEGKEKLVILSPIVLDEQSSKVLMEKTEHRLISGIHSARTVKRTEGDKRSEAVRMIPANSILFPSCSIGLNFGWQIPYKIGYNYVLKTSRR